MARMLSVAMAALALGVAVVLGTPASARAQACGPSETGVKATLILKEPVPAGPLYSAVPGASPKLTLVLQLRFCGQDFITTAGTGSADYMRRLLFSRGAATISNTTEVIAHDAERWCRRVNGVRLSPPLPVFAAEVIPKDTVLEYTLDDARTAYDLRQPGDYSVVASMRLFSASSPALFSGCSGFGTQPLINLVDPDNREVTVVSNALEFSLGTATTPPTTVLTARAPVPNAAGWNNTDVTLALSASGGTVQSITAVVNGVETVYPGASASVTVAAEGVNSVTWYATGAGGVRETAPAPITVSIDKTAPSVAFGTPTPAPNASGWNRTPVTIPFTATDATSGIASVRVRPDGVATPTGTVLLTDEGDAVRGRVRVIDNADNRTRARTPAVKIDTTPPRVTCSASPSVLWPANHKLVPVTVTVNVRDWLSGPDGFTLVSVTSSERDSGLGDGDVPNDIQGFIVGTGDTKGSLRAERASKAGRVYTLTYRGRDKAGNTRTCAATVTVPHSAPRDDDRHDRDRYDRDDEDDDDRHERYAKNRRDDSNDDDW